MSLLWLVGIALAGGLLGLVEPATGRTALRATAIACGAALVGVLVLAWSMGTGDETLFAGAITTGAFARLVLVLWALGALGLGAISWLLGGLDRVRGLLAGNLLALAAAGPALGAIDPLTGLAAAGVAGLAALPIVFRSGRPTTIPVIARELRAVVVGTVLAAIGGAVLPIAAALSLGQTGQGGETAAGSATGGEPAAVLGLGFVTVVLGVAVRSGAIPFHLRLPRLVDVTPPAAIPLLLAWAPLPLIAASLAAVDRLVVPVALPLEGERWLVVVLAAVALSGAALAAYAQDDVRHATAYLVAGDLGLVLLGFGALDPAAWGPARAWLLVLAISKTALAAWTTVAEERFESRSIGDMGGWIRRAPVLAAGYVLVIVATFGLPGWVAFSVRGDLARLAAGSPVDAALIVLSFATLPAYLRLLLVGTRRTTSHVAGAVPERLGWVSVARPTGGRAAQLAGGAAMLRGALVQNRAPIASGLVVVLALVAVLASAGALDLAGAAAEAPTTPANGASD